VKRRWLVPVVVLLLAAGTTVAIWRLGTSPAPEVAETPAFRGLAAIRDIELELPSYGTGPDSEAFGRALAQLLRSASVAVISPDELRRRGEPRNTAEWLAAAEEHDARLLVSGSISERQGRAVARFEVLDVITKRVAARTFDADPDRIGVLLHSVASWLADLTNPGITLPQPNRLLAGDLLKLGNDELKEHRSARARTFFEQAVLAEPTSAEAWDRYATSLGMMAAKRSATIAAAARAYELAPEGPRKKILHATLLNYRLEFSAALAELTPLEHAGLTGDNLRDLLFQIGESHWHEGRHDLGFSYFKRTLELDGKFSEAASHAGEYAIARRDEASGREYLRMQRYELEHIDFAVGKYEELVKAGRFPYDLWSQIVLGLPERAPPTPLTRQEQIYKHLTAAAVDNDAALVEAETEKLLANVEPFTAGIGDLLIHMGEVVIAADMKKPVAKILAVLQANQRGYHYRRLAILASPMLGAPKFPRAELTERLVHLTAAIDAELAGDRAQAAKLLGELVDNPTYEWDFVERLALRRNLLALGRTKEADALCADTLRPTTMRYVFKVVQRICKP
jgi:tetratricopeptide (TPR) repeat protein